MLANPSSKMNEAKNQLLFSVPMILIGIICYSIALVSVMFASHLGELELAGAVFANSWASVTGLSVLLSGNSIYHVHIYLDFTLHNPFVL